MGNISNTAALLAANRPLTPLFISDSNACFLAISVSFKLHISTAWQGELLQLKSPCSQAISECTLPCEILWHTVHFVLPCLHDLYGTFYQHVTFFSTEIVVQTTLLLLQFFTFASGLITSTTANYLHLPQRGLGLSKIRTVQPLLRHLPAQACCQQFPLITQAVAAAEDEQ